MRLSESKDGGSAFPVDRIAVKDGMSLRDYFAAQALTALIAKMPVEIACDEGSLCEQVVRIVRGAYGYADAMLKERAK